MLDVRYSSQFRRDYKLLLKRGLPMKELQGVVELLRNQEPLPIRCHDHPLIGSFAGFRECHIRPDWLLIYRITDSELILVLQRTGSHADLFDE